MKSNLGTYEVYKVYCTPKNGAQGLPHSRYFSSEEKALEFIAENEITEYWGYSYTGKGKAYIERGEIEE
jgi:hypothetical protein